MRIDDSFFRRIETISADNTVHKSTSTKTNIQFNDVLQEAENRISFSKHAMKRLDERGIEITDSQLEKLNSAIEMAKTNGIKDSLVLMDGKAFIVNIPSNTVVTVLDSGEVSNQKVFSNLNGTVII
jgi:flagellar operon protein